MIEHDPRYAHKLFVVTANGERYGKFLSREEAQKAISRYASGYGISPDDCRITEELFS